jgi:hypothetical protein
MAQEDRPEHHHGHDSKNSCHDHNHATQIATEPDVAAAIDPVCGMLVQLGCGGSSHDPAAGRRGVFDASNFPNLILE